MIKNEVIWQWRGCRSHMSSTLKISCSVYGRGEKFCMVGMCLTGHRFQKLMLQKCSASIDFYQNHRVIWHRNGNFHCFQLVSFDLYGSHWWPILSSINVASQYHTFPDSIIFILDTGFLFDSLSSPLQSSLYLNMEMLLGQPAAFASTTRICWSSVIPSKNSPQSALLE